MSNSPIQSDIQAAIEKHLPTQVGRTLQERLDQADKDREELATAIAKNDSLLVSLRDARAEIEKMQALLLRHREIDQRVADVTARERNAKVAELEVQLAAERASKEFAEKMALGLVRNTEYRRNRMGMVPLVNEYADNYGVHRTTSSIMTNVEESERSE